jgi:hypothetical protein
MSERSITISFHYEFKLYYRNVRSVLVMIKCMHCVCSIILQSSVLTQLEDKAG